MEKTGNRQIHQILLIQLGATFIVSVGLLVIDTVYFMSALAGGLIATLANAYFAWKVFARQQESGPEQILATYYAAEVGKIILTVMMFIGAIVLIKPLSIVTLMGVYLFNHMIPWLASFVINDDELIRRDKNGG
ncbi:MAG: ATP synthase subunit I [Gammaproteobacteria bacterium]|nr:ATP synthase subunit I [Gammaproteobacteria bacterium]